MYSARRTFSLLSLDATLTGERSLLAKLRSRTSGPFSYRPGAKNIDTNSGKITIDRGAILICTYCTLKYQLFLRENISCSHSHSSAKGSQSSQLIHFSLANLLNILVLGQQQKLKLLNGFISSSLLENRGKRTTWKSHQLHF